MDNIITTITLNGRENIRLLDIIYNEFHEKKGQTQGSAPTITLTMTNSTKRKSLSTFFYPFPPPNFTFSTCLKM